MENVNSVRNWGTCLTKNISADRALSSTRLDFSMESYDMAFEPVKP